MSEFLFREKFDDDSLLFSLAFHPTKPYYAKGFSDGRVTTTKYTLNEDDGTYTLETVWTTKRHKGSCRGLAYNYDGTHLYSIGTDKTIKMADAFTGIVHTKTKEGLEAEPSCIAINDTYLAVGDDSACLNIYNLTDLKLVKSFPDLQEGFISSITPLTHKNKYQFVTSGDSKLVHVDIRKGVLKESEDQEDEILCGCMAGEKTGVFGMSEGVLTLWNEYWEDQQNRILLTKETVDCVIPGEDDDIVFAGCGDGIVREVDVRDGKILNLYKHSKDSVDIIEFDYDYHLVTANTDMIKVWKKKEELSSNEDSDAEQQDEGSKKRKKKKTKSKTKKLARLENMPVKGIAAFDDL